MIKYNLNMMNIYDENYHEILWWLPIESITVPSYIYFVN
jgi:hypothetical protein